MVIIILLLNDRINIVEISIILFVVKSWNHYTKWYLLILKRGDMIFLLVILFLFLIDRDIFLGDFSR